jgi:hypothetical protein
MRPHDAAGVCGKLDNGRTDRFRVRRRDIFLDFAGFFRWFSP